MTDEIAFLYEAAAELRSMASAAPNLAEELRRLAAELEEKASEFAQARCNRRGKAAAPD
jgi:hypothetical protein